MGEDIPKRSPLFQEKLCWLLTCSQVKPGWEAQDGLQTFPKKTGAGFSRKILLEVPGSLPWKPSVAKGSRARKFQVFGAAGSGFPPARKNLWNGGIRARGAVRFGVGTEQSPPRLKLNLFGVKQPPKNSFGANPPLSTPVPQFPHPGRASFDFPGLRKRGLDEEKRGKNQAGATSDLDPRPSRLPAAAGPELNGRFVPSRRPRAAPSLPIIFMEPAVTLSPAPCISITAGLRDPAGFTAAFQSCGVGEDFFFPLIPVFFFPLFSPRKTTKKKRFKSKQVEGFSRFSQVFQSLSAPKVWERW